MASGVMRKVEAVAFNGRWLVTLACGHHLRVGSMEQAEAMKGRVRKCRWCRSEDDSVVEEIGERT